MSEIRKVHEQSRRPDPVHPDSSSMRNIRLEVSFSAASVRPTALSLMDARFPWVARRALSDQCLHQARSGVAVVRTVSRAFGQEGFARSAPSDTDAHQRMDGVADVCVYDFGFRTLMWILVVERTRTRYSTHALIKFPMLWLESASCSGPAWPNRSAGGRSPSGQSSEADGREVDVIVATALIDRPLRSLLCDREPPVHQTVSRTQPVVCVFVSPVSY